ncbi:MAG: hypothetical protein QM775_07535 [Pirellulales bacterium]
MLRITKIAVSGLTMLGLLVGSVAPSQAGPWGQVQYGYGNAYQAQYQPVGNYGYPVQPVGQDDHPILKKVLVGGALVGLGFLAGRLTAPKPQYNYYPTPVPQYPPMGGPRPGHGHHHRF